MHCFETGIIVSLDELFSSTGTADFFDELLSDNGSTAWSPSFEQVEGCSLPAIWLNSLCETFIYIFERQRMCYGNVSTEPVQVNVQ